MARLARQIAKLKHGLDEPERGISAVVEIMTTPNNCSRDSAARPVSPVIDRIRERLMDTATNTSPVSVAAAPAIVDR